MKRFFIAAAIAIAASSSYAQQNPVPPGDGTGNPCPPPLCVVKTSFSIDKLNFHKPRTNCESLFGFCLKTTVSYTCGYGPCLNAPEGIGNQSTSLVGSTVNGWIKILTRKVEIHLPIALAATGQFGDMKLFSTDASMITITDNNGNIFGKIRAGDYPTSISGNDIVIVADLE